MKPAESLTVADLQAHPVWEYVNNDALGETLVRPVKRLPAENLNGKVVGTQVRLGNGSSIWALLCNIHASNAKFTEHFVTLALFHDRHWCHLARYFDFNYADAGPEALARVLGLSVDEVFPITYDVRPYAKGDGAALSGQVGKEPRERLSEPELMAMSIP